MPKIGDIIRGKQIGKKDKSRKFIFSKCNDCSKKRWVRCEGNNPLYELCKKCSVLSGKNHPLWKGGRHISDGYIRISLGNGKRKHEHRLIVENNIGRKLRTDEIVHHIDLNKSNNSKENLHICNRSSHKKLSENLLKIAGELYRLGKIRFRDGEYYLISKLN